MLGLPALGYGKWSWQAFVGGAGTGALGVSVGIIVGANVGDFVGVSVGSFVGEAVGSSDGSFVGASVGTGVGDSVGVSVGEEVGGNFLQIGIPLGSDGVPGFVLKYTKPLTHMKQPFARSSRSSFMKSQVSLKL
jgi:hypothetical protein